jgi:hypothetical protein
MPTIQKKKKTKEEKKLEDQMARYRTTGRWVGGL